MTEGEKTLQAIREAAVGAALSVWLRAPLARSMDENMDAAIAAYERALIRPIADAPKDGTAILTFDCNNPCGWCEDSWSLESNGWEIDPDGTPTHFRELPPETELPEIPDAQ